MLDLILKWNTVIGQVLLIYEVDMLRLIMEYDVNQMATVAVLAYLDPFDQIFKDFFQVSWLNFSNNALDFCFQFRNCLWFVRIDLGHCKTQRKKLQGVKSQDLGGQLMSAFLEITQSGKWEKNIVLTNRWFFLLYGMWHHPVKTTFLWSPYHPTDPTKSSISCHDNVLHLQLKLG